MALRLIHSRPDSQPPKKRMLRCAPSSRSSAQPLPDSTTLTPLERLRVVRPIAAAEIDRMIATLLLRGPE